MSQNNSPMSHHRSDPLFDLLLLCDLDTDLSFAPFTFSFGDLLLDLLCVLDLLLLFDRDLLRDSLFLELLLLLLSRLRSRLPDLDLLLSPLLDRLRDLLVGLGYGFI